MGRKKIPVSPHAKTPEEKVAIRAAGGIGDTKIVKGKVPTNKERIAAKAEKENNSETGSKFKQIEGVDTTRVSGEEEQGPSAAPKPKVKGPLVSTGRKMRQTGLRPAKNREMQKGVMAVTLATETPKPRKAKKRTTTRTGKKIDPKTGQVAVPKKGQAAKVDGTVVRVDSANIEEAQRQARTTVLPTAGPETPKPTYELPGAPNTVAEQGYSQSSPEHHEQVKGLTAKAFLHLSRLQDTHGTDASHEHLAAFNETHAHVAQLDHSMGEILKVAHTAATNPNHPDSPKQFAWAKQAAGERLGLGKKTMNARTERSQAGRAKRMERIRAEQAAKEGQ